MSTTQNTNQPQALETWHLRQTVTAFVDLLGLSNALEALDRIVDEDLEEPSARPIVQTSIGRVLRFRALFDTAFNEMSSRKEKQPKGLPEDLVGLWKQSLESDVRISHFSDCALINVIVQRRNLLATARGMIHLCSSLGYACLRMMAEGQLVRGGIDTGVAIAPDGEQEVLGSGLVHSYGLECRVAEDPRICIGPRFLGLLSAMTPPSDAREPESLVLRRNLDVIRSFLIGDLDGLPRLQILHPIVLAAASEAGEGDLVNKARDALRDSIATLGATQGTTIKKKVNWAVNVLLALPAPPP